MQKDRTEPLDDYLYSSLYCGGMEDELDDLEEEVALKPFAHQVGGHSSVMLLNEWTVCKPLINREKKFYENIPREIGQFTPQYKGVIEVSFVQNNDGLVSIVAHPPQKPVRQRRKSNSSMSSGESCNSGSDSDSESQHSSPRRSKHCTDSPRLGVEQKLSGAADDPLRSKTNCHQILS